MQLSASIPESKCSVSVTGGRGTFATNTSCPPLTYVAGQRRRHRSVRFSMRDFRGYFSCHAEL